MSETINGWLPPVIYDVSIDEKRIATQEDIDRMEIELRRLGEFYRVVRREVEGIERKR